MCDGRRFQEYGAATEKELLESWRLNRGTMKLPRDVDRSRVSERGWQSSVKYVGADPWTTRYINEQSLYEILSSMGNQCSCRSNCRDCVRGGAFKTARAARLNSQLPPFLLLLWSVSRSSSCLSISYLPLGYSALSCVALSPSAFSFIRFCVTLCRTWIRGDFVIRVDLSASSAFSQLVALLRQCCHVRCWRDCDICHYAFVASRVVTDCNWLSCQSPKALTE